MMLSQLLEKLKKNLLPLIHITFYQVYNKFIFYYFNYDHTVFNQHDYVYLLDYYLIPKGFSTSFLETPYITLLILIRI